jgi:ferrous iron transport protein B
MTRNIALLGQPNAGKSTLFNRLTGANQHVGNWPGKTVEKKTGSFTHNLVEYSITDLPGTYSLSANSVEEILTRDFIDSEETDLIVVMTDASQLERSMYMLADCVGVNCPVMLVVNMMDVAAKQGKYIDIDQLQKNLQIPVVGMSASNANDYDNFLSTLESAREKIPSSEMSALFLAKFGLDYNRLCLQCNCYNSSKFSDLWLAAKIMENDKEIINLTGYKGKCLDRPQVVDVGKCKFKWIEAVLNGVVTVDSHIKPELSSFDRLATHHIWGKPIAISLLIFGLIASFLIAIPWMHFCGWLPQVFIESLGADMSEVITSTRLLSLINTLLMAVGTSLGMVGFIGSSALVFGLMEDVGYMARVAYVFDNAMSKIHLHGKSIMAFMMSFGCSAGGSVSTRVIDSYGQRVLTMALAWLVPCAATWGVIAVFGFAFFGLQTVLIIIILLICSFLMIFIVVKLFAPGLVSDKKNSGLLMELPPYHKPKWGSLFRFVYVRMGGFVRRVFTFILSVSAVFWALAYSSDGNIENSLIYKFGSFIEPVTMWFGLRWQTFVAFIGSMMGKEASLGVLSSVFGASTLVPGQGAVNPDLASSMRLVLTKAEALAFIFAFWFNIPCFVAVLAVKEETRSWKWTLRMILMYIGIALIMAGLAYWTGRLIWP